MADKIQDVEAFLATARERFQLCQESEIRLREDALEDLRFYSGDQWDDSIRAQRTIDNRPCLTINRLPQFVRQVTNEQRQNRPQIQISPVDDNADVETAEVLQGLVRHIEVSSDADTAYDTAFEHACVTGFGFFRLLTDYTDPESFDQDILIERIDNQFTVYLDPNARKADRSDARYGFIVDSLSHDEFKQLHPDSELVSLQEFSSLGDRFQHWLDKSSVRVAEYYCIETRKRSLCLMQDGAKLWKDEIPEQFYGMISKERQVDAPLVRWAKINGAEILEQTIVPGRFIPIIPVFGDELVIDGERKLYGMVRHARDPQRMYNYWATAETETIALAPRAPFIAAEGQIEGHEQAWRTANSRNHAVLLYKPRAIADVAVPPPQRNSYEPPVQAITNARMQSSDDLKATTGIFDAALGARSNETSGVAIRQRQKEGDTANFHYTDNLARALRHAGRIILSWIPYVYDTPRVLRIIGRDEEQRTVQVNAPTVEKGVERIYDLTTGKYDVTVSVGPSYMTKRQEAAESMMQMTQAFPPLFQIAGDLMVKNMDWPGAPQIADRLKKALPPQFQEQEDNPHQIVAGMQQKLQEQGMLLEQLTAGLNEATRTIESKKLELESRERIAALQTQAQLLMKQADLGSREGIEMLKQEIAALGSQIDQQLREKEHQDALEQAERDRQAAAAQREADAALPEAA